MKKLLFSLLAVSLSTFAMAQSSEAVAKFKTDVIDMGKIPQGVPASATFTVTNSGTTPLIIEEAQPTCGCTTKDFTKEPIMPGKSGTITAIYNAQSMAGFEKHMNVKFAGYPEYKSITIKGEVITAAEYAKLKGTKPANATSKDAKTKSKNSK